MCVCVSRARPVYVSCRYEELGASNRAGAAAAMANNMSFIKVWAAPIVPAPSSRCCAAQEIDSMRTEIKAIKSSRRARELAGGTLGGTARAAGGGGGSEGGRDLAGDIAAQRTLIGDLKAGVCLTAPPSRATASDAPRTDPTP